MAFFGSKSVLGVDLGTAGIKIAELSRGGGGRFDLKNYGLLDFVADESSSKLGDQVLISGLKDLLARGRFSTKDAAASISSFLTFATVIELPYLSEKDLEKAIPFEARKYVPIPLQEVVLDWSIISVKQDSQHPNVEVFLAAVPKDEVERYKNIFLAAGLNLKALELENIALSRALAGEDKSALAMVNLGGRSTSIVIIDNGFERISRNYELGGLELTRALSKALGVSIERAEQMKRAEGLNNKSASLVDALTPLIDLIVLETKKIISNYEENKKLKIGKIFLAGGQANMPGLKEYFSGQLSRETVIGDPFGKISFNRALEPALKVLRPSLSVALGLAMRKI